MQSEKPSAKDLRPAQYMRSRQPRKVQFQEVKRILGPALRKFGLEEKITRYAFVLHWKEIVGSEIALRSRPESIRAKTLFVTVKDAIWAQELGFQKEVILKRLKPYLTEGQELTDVMFVVGRV
jgi:predicted nucleic acid-binding Zn ribbon protein